MKNLLIASTALVGLGFAGAASADGHAMGLTLTGSADFGIATVSQGGNTDSYFIHDFDISWAANGTTDGGLTFSASGQLDDDATPSVSIGGAFGTVSFGDEDDARDAALPGVSTAGLEDNPGSVTTFTDVNNNTTTVNSGSSAYGVASGASIGDYDVTDSSLAADHMLYTSPSFGGATFFASYAFQGQAGAVNDAGAVGVRFVIGEYTIAAGYADSTAVEGYAIGFTGPVGPATVSLQYRDDEVGALDNEDLDASVTFLAGAGTVGIMASFDLDAPAGQSDENGYGIWYDLPLGGGATLNVAAGHDAKADADEFGVGVSMTF